MRAGESSLSTKSSSQLSSPSSSARARRLSDLRGEGAGGDVGVNGIFMNAREGPGSGQSNTAVQQRVQRCMENDLRHTLHDLIAIRSVPTRFVSVIVIANTPLMCLLRCLKGVLLIALMAAWACIVSSKLKVVVPCLRWYCRNSSTNDNQTNAAYTLDSTGLLR